MEIKYFDRESRGLKVEQVYGDAAVKWMYNSASGSLLSNLLCRAPFSVVYGAWQDTPFSRKKVVPFIRNFDIKIEEYELEEGRNESSPYSSFNNFFIRKFRPGKREFDSDPAKMPAFCEARYFGYESIKDDQTIPVKGVYLNSEALLANSKWEETFRNGPLLLARLCPVDYHRFHYPDDGSVVDHYRVPGLYHSVNPIALKKKEDIFSTNERHVSILETKNFGKLAYVEVGAMCVGKIVQSTDMGEFKRGDEKGYFLFGGSTVIVIGEKGAWKPSEDILKYTSEGLETYVKLGNELATKV